MARAQKPAPRNIFISYSHRDAGGYAANLKKQIDDLDFTCFIDEEEYRE